MAKGTKSPKSSKFRVVSLLVFALIIGVIGYVILFQSQAAVPAAPTVYMTPETNTRAVNTTFTVQLRENSGTTGVSAVQAAFTYPTNLIDYVSVDNTGSSFTTVAETSNNAGKVVVARGIAGGGALLTGDQLIATVTFRTKTTSGTGNLTMLTGDTQLLDGVNFTNMVSGTGRIQGSTVTVDATLPTVSVGGVTNNQSIASGSTVPLAISATDDTGVTSVEVYIDGTLRQTLTTTPYTYQWNTTGVALGDHTIQARAKDAYGNTGSSSTITVSVADKTNPTATLTAPAANSTLKGTVTVSANAADTGGTSITKVEFYAGSTLIGQDTTSPYSIAWNTTTIADGSVALTARAYDGATPPNQAPSPAVTVTVENTDRQAPTAPTNLRTTGTKPTAANIAWNASTDNVGVTGYRVSRNGTLITTVTGLTFNDTGLSPSTTYNYSVVAVDAAGNASTAATLSVSTPLLKPGDFDADGDVDTDDLAKLLGTWGSTTATQYDIDKKGSVDIVDLAIILGNWGS